VIQCSTYTAIKLGSLRLAAMLTTPSMVVRIADRKLTRFVVAVSDTTRPWVAVISFRVLCEKRATRSFVRQKPKIGMPGSQALSPSGGTPPYLSRSLVRKDVGHRRRIRVLGAAAAPLGTVPRQPLSDRQAAASCGAPSIRQTTPKTRHQKVASETGGGNGASVAKFRTRRANHISEMPWYGGVLSGHSPMGGENRTGWLARATRRGGPRQRFIGTI
jgi:hypothetical protein